MFKKLSIALVALSAMALTAKAVVIELALVIDASGSISAANYTTQRNAYVSAVTNVVPTDGTIAIGVWEFAANVQQVLPMTVMDAAGKTSLLAALNGLNRNGINTGATAIGDAITVAASALAAFGNPSTKQVIDVSTDGLNNAGSDPAVASAAARVEPNPGVDQINALGIGSGVTAASLQAFVGGAGSFYDLSATFGDFEATLTRKLQRELAVPDAGSSLILMALGLLSLAAIRRKVVA